MLCRWNASQDEDLDRLLFCMSPSNLTYMDPAEIYWMSQLFGKKWCLFVKCETVKGVFGDQLELVEWAIFFWVFVSV